MRLLLTIHQWMRAARHVGGAWEQRVMDRVVDELTTLIATAQQPDDERDQQLDRLQQTMLALRDESALRETSALRGKRYQTWRHEQLFTIHYDVQHGHHDSFGVINQADDIPEWALGPFTTPRQFQLLAGRTNTGIIYQLDAPRHSWAHTVHLPIIPWPNFSDLAQELQRHEKNAGAWLSLPQSRACGFVCVLAFVQQNKIIPSSLPLDYVRDTIINGLAQAPAFTL
jgi:hypothetical protein